MGIYFAQCGKFVKIGYFAQSADDRIKSLQTGNPIKINILATIPGEIKDEKALHRLFARFHHSGEWFNSKIIHDHQFCKIIGAAEPRPELKPAEFNCHDCGRMTLKKSGNQKYCQRCRDDRARAYSNYQEIPDVDDLTEAEFGEYLNFIWRGAQWLSSHQLEFIHDMMNRQTLPEEQKVKLSQRQTAWLHGLYRKVYKRIEVEKSHFIKHDQSENKYPNIADCGGGISGQPEKLQIAERQAV